MSENALRKVTAFVTRRGRGGLELLLFRHPNAGVQFPAGTVEPGEAPAQAALREVREETGLGDVCLAASIGSRVEAPAGGSHVIARLTRVYARPDPTSFDWAELRPGIVVQVERRQAGYTQVTYEEWDRYPVGSYVTYCLTGWVPDETRAETIERHFFHLQSVGGSPAAWAQRADNHTFRPFWASLAALPPLVAPQDGWLPYVQGELGYRFLPEIETARLRLRPIAWCDLGALAALWADPEVMRCLPTGVPRPLEATRGELAHMVGHWRRHGSGSWAITRRGESDFLGYALLQHLHVEPGGVTAEALHGMREVELGYGLGRVHWGQGIAGEAAAAVLRYAFETARLPRVVAAIRPQNTASRRILERLGMQERGDLRVYGDCPHFALERAEFVSRDASYSLYNA